MTEIKIRNLRKESDSFRWTWTVIDSDVIHEYRTNAYGEGLWVYAPNGCVWVENGKSTPVFEWRQIEGTCQFSLKGYTISGARRKLLRKFTQNEI